MRSESRRSGEPQCRINPHDLERVQWFLQGHSLEGQRESRLGPLGQNGRCHRHNSENDRENDAMRHRGDVNGFI